METAKELASFDADTGGVPDPLNSRPIALVPDAILGLLIVDQQLIDQFLVDSMGRLFSSLHGRLLSSIYPPYFAPGTPGSLPSQTPEWFLETQNQVVRPSKTYYSPPSSCYLRNVITS